MLKHILPLRTALAAAAAAAVLVACGSGGDDDGGTSPPPTPPTSSTDVPGSALASSSGLVAYVRQLIGSSSETAEPVRIGDVVLPVDNTAEPASVN